MNNIIDDKVKYVIDIINNMDVKNKCIWYNKSGPKN